jgi:hypothetical protein
MDPLSDQLVPFTWPATWTGPALLKLLAGSAMNCLIFERISGAQPVVVAARAAHDMPAGALGKGQ